MQQRVSFVTLAVDDLDAARRFYLSGLGWTAALDVPGEVIMIRVGEHLVLSLWDERAFAAEVRPVRRGTGVAPITLSHNVSTNDEVDAVLDLARAAGAGEVGVAEQREWGGYSGYFADPAGFRWEVAVNPGPIGQVVLPADRREGVRLNDHDQPIGPAVDDWVAPPRPTAPEVNGGWCRLAPLSADPSDDVVDQLAARLAGPGSEPLWTYLREGPFPTREEFATYVRQRAADPGSETVVIMDAADVACGLASYLRIDPANGCVEIGSIVLGPGLQRTTAATEAMSLLAGHAFDLGHRRYEWKCDALNAPSRRAAERLGFTYEGTFRQHVVTKGRRRDTAWYAMTVDEWPRIAAAHRRWLDPANFEGGTQRRTLAEFLAS
ncbi:GNAT family N-acetyltransferase [Propionibacteriaceae bacterium Y2011]